MKLFRLSWLINAPSSTMLEKIWHSTCVLLHLPVIKRTRQCVLPLFSAGLVDCMSHSLQKIMCCCNYSQAVGLANKSATKMTPNESRNSRSSKSYSLTLNSLKFSPEEQKVIYNFFYSGCPANYIKGFFCWRIYSLGSLIDEVQEHNFAAPAENHNHNSLTRLFF